MSISQNYVLRRNAEDVGILKFNFFFYFVRCLRAKNLKTQSCCYLSPSKNALLTAFAQHCIPHLMVGGGKHAGHYLLVHIIYLLSLIVLTCFSTFSSVSHQFTHSFFYHAHFPPVFVILIFSLPPVLYIMFLPSPMTTENVFVYFMQHLYISI